MSLSRFHSLLKRIKYPQYNFVVLKECEDHYFLRIECPDGICNVTGKSSPWVGRKWRLTPHMTDGEVVQTAFLALMTALEHEAREQFTFDGVSVFDPHYDIHKLVSLRRRADSLAERP